MMSDRFKSRYRIESARLRQWNYGWNAAYFITICTQGRTCFFGEVVDGEMGLNDLGLIARDGWLAIPDYYPFVTLGECVVMPNHVHGILVIDKPDDGRDARDGRDERDVETRLIASLPDDGRTGNPGGITGNKNPMLHKNLSTIIRLYKGRTTYEIRKMYPGFAWQPRFHDHIIRDNRSFRRISDYIIKNPLNWSQDQFSQ